jgi:hypothetical protein
MAASAFAVPNAKVSVPPIASHARNEIAPSAVLPTRNGDQRRAASAVKRSAKSSSVWLATHWLYWRRTLTILWCACMRKLQGGSVQQIERFIF